MKQNHLLFDRDFSIIQYNIGTYSIIMRRKKLTKIIERPEKKNSISFLSTEYSNYIY